METKTIEQVIFERALKVLRRLTLEEVLKEYEEFAGKKAGLAEKELFSLLAKLD
jgi:hypothetical protein